MTSPQYPSGEIATEVFFENEYVKDWNMDLQPGQSSPWHHHRYWYVTVTTVPGSLRVEFPVGTSRCDTLQVGDVRFRANDSVHRVTNVGDSRYVSVTVELTYQSDAGCL